ncbi:MAG: DUF697 domain-containing protein [Desulfuromonadales bacterium]|nr:DUF697 domain-containing protein [Desulfuromonadales bacterium]
MTEKAGVAAETVSTETEVSREDQAAKVVKNHLYMAAGFGVIPIPIVDMVGFMAVQYDMTKKITDIYAVDFSKERIRTIVISLLGSILPVALTGTAASLLKFVPVLGTFSSSIAVSSLGSASTYAIGRVLIQHFEAGGTLLDFDAAKMRDYFKQEFKAGKETAKAAK